MIEDSKDETKLVIEVPFGWSEATFGDVFRVQGGYAFKSVDFVNDGIPLVRIGDLTNGEVTFSEKTVYLPSDFQKENSGFVLQRGDVLMALSGATTGKMAVYSESTPALLNQRVGRFIHHLEGGLDKKFGKYLVIKIVDKALDEAYGGAQPNISPAAIQRFKILLPPKNEQTRIVTAIESLQQRSTRARALLTEVEPLIKNLRQSILQSAFSGRLTADWRAKNPDVEPADRLLERIRNERRQRWEMDQLAGFEAKGKKPPKGWKDKYKEPEPVDDSELPELPEGWCWVFLPDIGEVNRGKSKHRPRNAEHLYGGVYPFVQTGDIANSEGYVTSHTQTYSEAGLAQSRIWPEGTVCITIAANIASSAVLTYEACFPDSVVGVLPNLAICEPEYVEYFIRTAKENLERFAPSTAQKNINLGTLSELAIPVPPIAESRELVSRVSDGMQLISKVFDIAADTELSLNQLDQSILSKAFRGELVPQVSNDEPAAELLARISAARKAEDRMKKASSKKGI